MACYEKRGKAWTVRFRTNEKGEPTYKRLGGFETKKKAEEAYREYMLLSHIQTIN